MTPLETIRRIWVLWEARDMEHVVAYLRPDVVHDLSHYDGWPGEPVHEGLGPALASLGDWMTWWHAYRQDLVGFEAHGRRVLAVLRHTGEQAGERVEGDLGILFYVDADDRVERWEPWSDLDAARAAMRGG